MSCGFCHGLGRIKEYGDEWACPSCNPQHNFRSHCGLAPFKDADGNMRQSWQMVSELDGHAYANLDFCNNTVERFWFADSVRDEASDWKSNLCTRLLNGLPID